MPNSREEMTYEENKRLYKIFSENGKLKIINSRRTDPFVPPDQFYEYYPEKKEEERQAKNKKWKNFFTWTGIIFGCVGIQALASVCWVFAWIVLILFIILIVIGIFQ